MFRPLLLISFLCSSSLPFISLLLSASSLSPLSPIFVLNTYPFFPSIFSSSLFIFLIFPVFYPLLPFSSLLPLPFSVVFSTLFVLNVSPRLPSPFSSFLPSYFLHFSILFRLLLPRLSPLPFIFSFLFIVFFASFSSFLLLSYFLNFFLSFLVSDSLFPFPNLRFSFISSSLFFSSLPSLSLFLSSSFALLTSSFVSISVSYYSLFSTLFCHSLSLFHSSCPFFTFSLLSLSFPLFSYISPSNFLSSSLLPLLPFFLSLIFSPYFNLVSIPISSSLFLLSLFSCHSFY